MFQDNFNVRVEFSPRILLTEIYCTKAQDVGRTITDKFSLDIMSTHCLIGVRKELFQHMSMVLFTMKWNPSPTKGHSHPNPSNNPQTQLGT